MRDALEPAVDLPPALRSLFARLGWSKAPQQQAAAELVAYLTQPATALFEYLHAQPAELGGGVARAIEEGEHLKRDILSRSDMLAPAPAAALANISRQALDLRRKNYQALALSHGKRGFRYPAWQFSDQLAPMMAEILPRLADLDPWAQYFLLTDPEPLLANASIVDTIRVGKQRDARRVLEILRRPE